MSQLDLIVRGGRIIDGTGAAEFTGDIGVRVAKLLKSVTRGQSIVQPSVSFPQRALLLRRGL